MENQKVSSTRDREIRVSRLLDAPAELVWEVWTKPGHIAQWWGPNGFTNTMHTMNLVVDGEWKFVMHGPDGTNYPNRAVFREVVPMKKLLYEHFNPHFIATILFEARGEKTFLSWHMLFDTAEQFIAVVKAHNAADGLKQNVEKLNVYLQKFYQ